MVSIYTAEHRVRVMGDLISVFDHPTMDIPLDNF